MGMSRSISTLMVQINDAPAFNGPISAGCGSVSGGQVPPATCVTCGGNTSLKVTDANCERLVLVTVGRFGSDCEDAAHASWS